MENASDGESMDLNQMAADVTQDSPPSNTVPETEPAFVRSKAGFLSTKARRWKVVRSGEIGELVAGGDAPAGPRITLRMPDGAEKQFAVADLEPIGE